jgi:hypothetical protein
MPENWSVNFYIYFGGSRDPAFSFSVFHNQEKFMIGEKRNWISFLQPRGGELRRPKTTREE